jgi:uncharacterized protein (TIGR02001 family)
MRLFVLLLILLSIKLARASSIEAQVGAYSNFIWRGVTFSENKPAIQASIDAEGPYSFYVGTFVSNAEFHDPYLDNDVTQEIDYIIGKRWFYRDLELQFYYSWFSFPNANEIDSDEFNFQVKMNQYYVELSYMDDYFGYKSIYKYVRVGYELELKKDLSITALLGYSDFSLPKGDIKRRCGDGSCSSPDQTFETTSGAGSTNYYDLYIVGAKQFRKLRAELGLNFTNRYEYSVDGGEVVKNKAKDFAAVVGLLLPLAL